MKMLQGYPNRFVGDQVVFNIFKRFLICLSCSSIIWFFDYSSEISFWFSSYFYSFINLFLGQLQLKSPGISRVLYLKLRQNTKKLLCKSVTTPSSSKSFFSEEQLQLQLSKLHQLFNPSSHLYSLYHHYQVGKEVFQIFIRCSASQLP